MNYLNEKVVLDFYLKQVEEGNVNYLKGKPQYEKRITEQVKALRECETIHKKIGIAKSLWKALFEAAMSDIDPDKRGYDKLFKYFDEYVNFEELIFASDSFYRDHTLHCLWVYFLGEYLMKNKEFDPVTKDMDSEYEKIKGVVAMFKDTALHGAIAEALPALENFIERQAKEESLRCIAALTHDLGYPLKKMEKINKCMGAVLPYFSIKSYNEFAFNYTDSEQVYIQSFIEHLSQTIECNIGGKVEDEELFRRVFAFEESGAITNVHQDAVEKLTGEEKQKIISFFKTTAYLSNSKADYWRYSKDFEEYKHGIMSAFLLMKNVVAMSNCSIKAANYERIDFRNPLLERDQMKLTILRSIADHTSGAYQIKSINNTSAFLTFIDELEEFSRLSRANQNREYIEEFCSSNIYMEENWLNIDFTFENTQIDNLDPERAFKGRCERFLSLFDIPCLDKSIKLRLRCIGMLPTNQNTYTLEIAHKYAKVMINDEEKHIPTYLKKTEFYSREEYQAL
ncbi:MAG: hypothetical protein ACRDDX_05350 [Cellulosilyticaceae bacterium]